MVSPVSGQVFEKRLIEKYIQENGVDPLNQQLGWSPESLGREEATFDVCPSNTGIFPSLEILSDSSRPATPCYYCSDPCLKEADQRRPLAPLTSCLYCSTARTLQLIFCRHDNLRGRHVKALLAGRMAKDPPHAREAQ